MPTETSVVNTGELEKKMDRVFDELAAIRDVVKMLSSVPRLIEKVEGLESDVKQIQKALSPLDRLDEVASSLKTLDAGLKEVRAGKAIAVLNKKVDSLSSAVNKVNAAIAAVKSSVSTAELQKKIDGVEKTLSELDRSVDDLKGSVDYSGIEKQLGEAMSTIQAVDKSVSELRAVSDISTLDRKIDGLQEYVTTLSDMADSVKTMGETFSETKEIVGIIVRQLDDIERKYNRSIEEITSAVATVTKIAESVKAAETARGNHTVAEEPAASTHVKRPSPDEPLPKTIDGLVDYLLALVTPQTEAADMAMALERVRDQITTMIKGHTPVLFQFGKRARELKSYPPTATLNENDVARLSRDIRTWGAKLKEMARNSE